MAVASILSGYPPFVEQWRDLVTTYAGNIPVEFLMEWINDESAGSPSALGASYEVGIFQLDLQDGPAWGGTLDTLHGNFSAGPSSQTLTRQLTDDERTLQVTSGIAYINHAVAVTQGQVSWSPSSSDFWNAVKMQHVLPGIMRLLPAAIASGATSWSDFRSYVLGLSQNDMRSSACPNCANYYYDRDGNLRFPHFFDVAEKVGAKGGGFSGWGAAIIGIAIAAALWYGWKWWSAKPGHSIGLFGARNSNRHSSRSRGRKLGLVA